MRLQRWLVLSVLALSACVPFLYDDRCGPETRSTVIRGDIRDAGGTRIGMAEVRLSETKGGAEPRQLQAVLMGPAYANPGPLSTHVQRVRLIDRGGAVLRDFTFRHANEHEIIWVPVEVVRDPAAFEALKRQFIANEVLLELETDLPGYEQLRVPLPLQNASDWSRAHCS